MRRVSGVTASSVQNTSWTLSCDSVDSVSIANTFVNRSVLFELLFSPVRICSATKDPVANLGGKMSMLFNINALKCNIDTYNNTHRCWEGGSTIELPPPNSTEVSSTTFNVITWVPNSVGWNSDLLLEWAFNSSSSFLKFLVAIEAFQTLGARLSSLTFLTQRAF